LTKDILITGFQFLTRLFWT